MTIDYRNRGIRLAGTILMADIDGSDLPVDGSFLEWGNSETFNISPQSDEVTIISNLKDTFGQALETMRDPKPTQFSFDINTFNPETFAEVNLGTVTERSTAGSTVTAEGHVAHLGKWIMADFAESMTAMVVTDTATGLTEYILGTDYEFNNDVGIRPLSSGSISEDEELDLDYTYETETGYKIAGATDQELTKYIFIDGFERIEGKDCKVKCYKAKFSPTTDIPLLNPGEPAKVSFSGTLVTPVGLTSPYDIIYRQTA